MPPRLTSVTETSGAFGLLIRTLRLQGQMSLSQFGDAVGVARQTVNHWERGRALPRPDAVIRIARATGTALVDVLRPIYECDEWEDERCRIPFEQS